MIVFMISHWTVNMVVLVCGFVSILMLAGESTFPPLRMMTCGIALKNYW